MTTETKINAIATLANNIKGNLTTNVVGTNLEITAPPSTYVDNLPQGLNKEIARQVHDYDADLTMALTHAVGQVAVENFSTNGELTTASFEAKLDTNKVQVNVDKTRTFAVPGAKGEEPTNMTKLGSTQVKFVARAGRNGDLDEVRSLITEMATKAYGG